MSITFASADLIKSFQSIVIFIVDVILFIEKSLKPLEMLPVVIDEVTF